MKDFKPFVIKPEKFEKKQELYDPMRSHPG